MEISFSSTGLLFGIGLVLVGAVSFHVPPPTFAQVDRQFREWLEGLIGDGATQTIHRGLSALLVLIGLLVMFGAR